MLTKVSDIIAQTLQYVGVKRVYGIVGGGINALASSLSSSTSIRFVQMRNEESAGFAAGADAAMNKHLAVCGGAGNSGSVHFLNGIYDAHRNGSPVLLILSDRNQLSLGRTVINNVDLKSSFKACSCFCEYVRQASDVEHLLGLAMQTSISAKGVSVLIIPEDVFFDEIEFDRIEFFPRYSDPVIIPSEDELHKMAEMINNADHIVIYGGSGCENAHDEVMALSEKIKAPVGWAYRGKEYLDYGNTYPVGMNGLLGDQSCIQAFDECDLLLLLGTDFAFSTFYPDDTAIIQIDIKGEHLGRRHAITFGAVGDIKPSLELLLPLIEERDEHVFADRSTDLYHSVRKHLQKLTHQNNDHKEGIYPEYLSGLINRLAKKDALIVADIGTPWAYMAKYIDSFGTRKLYHSCLHGTMANALPSSIGMQLSSPEKQVIAMCGDGGFAMLMGEMLTLIQEKLPVKLIVFNNGKLDFVALEMKTEGLIDVSTDLKNPNFAQVAQAAGMKGIRVEDPRLLESSLLEAFNFNGPVLVDVVVNPDSLLMPPEISLGMAYDFSKYLWKQFLTGDEKVLWKLIKSNFPRQL
ncbi:MAG: thiamine pyrophosphate-dependent enzyme [Bacteroidales bacterium]